MDKPIDLRQYWRMIWRRRGLVLLCTITTLCAAFVTLFFVPKEYESQVTLMIEDSQLLSADLERVIGGGRTSTPAYKADEARLSKLIGRIRSRPFLERVVRLLKMQDDPVVRQLARKKVKDHPEVTEDEMAVRILVGNLQARIRFASAGPGIYKVTVADYSAENAQMLARWISELFVDVSNQVALDRIKSVHEFGLEQSRIYEEQLRRSEQALEDYKRAMIQRDLARKTVRADNLDRAETLYGWLMRDVNDARTRVTESSDSLARRPGSLDAQVSADARIRDLTANLSSTLNEEWRKRLSGTGTDVGDWPPFGTYAVLRVWLLQEVQLQVARQNPQASPDALELAARHEFAQLDLQAQMGAAEALGRAIGEFRSQAQSSPQEEIELARLETEVENNRRLLQSFRSQLVSSDLSRAVETTDLGLRIEVLDPADLPLTPSRPNRSKILLAALVLGPLIGLGIGFVGETLDPTLRTLEEFARVVPEPVLGTTPLLSRIRPRGRWLRRHWVPATVAGVVVLTVLLFVTRAAIVDSIAAIGRPVQMSVPQETAHERR